MRVLNIAISGAASKLPFIYGAVKTAMLGFDLKPKNISGISSGAIVSLFAALGRFDMDQVIFNIKEGDIFKVSPMTKKGKLSPKAILRVLRGKRSLGDQSNLKKTLKKHIKEDEFNAYVMDINSPNTYIGAVNYRTGDIQYFNLKKCDYNRAIDVVCASASIPGVAEGEVIDGDLFYDGGVIDYIGSSFLIKETECDNLISFYSRPDEYQTKEKEMKGMLSVLKRTIALLTKNVSVDDEALTDSMCKVSNIEHTKIFTQHTLMTETFKFDYDLNRAMFHLGVESAEDALRNYKL